MEREKASVAELGDAARAIDPASPLAQPDRPEAHNEHEEDHTLDHESRRVEVVPDQPRESTHSPPTV